MKKITKEVKIGIAFIVALFLLYFGINFLKGVNVFKPTNSYIVLFENVAGMMKSDPVTINGLKIGQVQEMHLNPQNPKNVLVYVQMEKGTRIPEGSKINFDVSMLGGSTLILEPNLNTSNYHVPGDTLIGDRKKGLVDAAENIVPKIEDLIPKLDSILANVNKLTTNPALHSTFDNLEVMTANFTKTSKEINVLLATVNKDFPAISNDLGRTVKNLSDISDQVKELDFTSTFNKFDSTMTNFEHLSSRLASKDSSLGLLLNDRQMYDSLNTTVGNASLLLRDVKENPSRYINIKVF